MLEPKERGELAHQIKQMILQPERARIDELGASITERNALFGGCTQYSWHLDQRIYYRGLAGKRESPKKPIHSSLREEAADLFRRTDKITEDDQAISHFLAIVLHRCQDYQDVRDGLPNSVFLEAEDHGLLHLASLPRTRPHGYMFADQPLLMNSFNAGMETVYYYLANRLLY